MINKPKYYAVIGLSFGTGKSNDYLAEAAYKIYKNCSVEKVILQKEIAEKFYHILNYENCKYGSLEKVEIIHKHRVKGKYLDTIEVLEQAKEICGENKEVILVAHQDHMPRCIKTARMMGFDPTEAIGFIPYDSSSENRQWWTRNKRFFLIWEFLAWMKLYIKMYVQK